MEPHTIEPTTFVMDASPEPPSSYDAGSLENDASIRDLSGWSDIRRENEGPDPFVVALRPGLTQMAGWTPMGSGAMEEDVNDY